MYRYLTNCTQCWDIRALDKMIESGKEITYRTFIQHCRGPDLDRWVEQKGYVWRGKGLTLRKDFAVSYWKSKYDGTPCYYIRWSLIEFIWCFDMEAK